MQIKAVRQRNDVIPGALEAFVDARKRGAAVGTCSGYNRPIMEVVMEGTHSGFAQIECSVLGFRVCGVALTVAIAFPLLSDRAQRRPRPGWSPMPGRAVTMRAQMDARRRG
jgi:hypothetical protein